MKLRNILLLMVVGISLFKAYEKIRTQRLEREYRDILSSVVFGSEPKQTNTSVKSFDFKGYGIKPLADFAIRARILSRKNYYLGRESELSPLDLALGWKRMADPAVYKQLRITQGSRCYFYSCSNQPPIPLQEIAESSANMHLIPASSQIKFLLNQAKKGRFVKIKGALVEISSEDGWRWGSSTSRSDTGQGACEVVFVEAVGLE